MLEIDVSKKYRETELRFTVSVNNQTPAITAVFGPSGAGKSSLLKLIAGLERPESGRIILNGQPLVDTGRRHWLPPERRRLGVVFQDARLFPHLSVRGNLLYGYRLCPPGERRLSLEPVVAVLGLGGLLDRFPGTLSGGERQRVAVGRALLASPRLLLMDEPLAALDGPRKQDILPFFARLPQEFGIPVLYVTHALDEVLRLADSLVLLKAGRVVAQGGVETLLNRPDLRPLTGWDDPAAVVPATVAGVDAEGMMLHTAAGPLWVGGAVDPALTVGTGVRLRLFARDVALATRPPVGISTRNCLAARIEGFMTQDGLVDVALSLDGGLSLVARITARARRDLALEEGQLVHALIKAVSLSGRGVTSHSP